TLTNTATVSGAPTDPNTANNSASATTAVSGSADLAVTKSDSPDPVTAGEDITYTINLDNAGPGDAQSVTLSDLIPAGTTFVSFTQDDGPTFNCTVPAVGGTGTVICTIATVAAYATTASFTLVVNVNASTAVGTIVNTVTVASTTPDPTPGNNTAMATTTVGTSADLGVTKTDWSDPVNAG